MSKRKLRQVKSHAAHLIHRFSTEQNFSSVEPAADDPTKQSSPFCAKPSGPVPCRRQSLRGFRSLRSRRRETLARPLTGIFRRRVSQANTGGEVLRRVRHRIDGSLRFDREAERARRRGSRPFDHRSQTRTRSELITALFLFKGTSDLSANRNGILHRPRDPHLVEIHSPESARWASFVGPS